MTAMFTLGRALIILALAFVFGGILIWRGATGDIWRSRYTGDAIIPGWLYVCTGVVVILLSAAWAVAAWLLGKG